MNNSRSCELKALNAMNYFRLWTTSMTLGLEIRALDATNNSELWMI